MIDVTCAVKNYDNPAKQRLLVHNHWNDTKQVVLEIGGEKYTVNANDLIEAIRNCVNVNRWGA